MGGNDLLLSTKEQRCGATTNTLALGDIYIGESGALKSTGCSTGFVTSHALPAATRTQSKTNGLVGQEFVSIFKKTKPGK